MFDWQTDEKVEWEEPKPKPAPKPGGRPRWPWAILLLVLLAGGTAVVVWQQLQSRIVETSAQVEDDILASVQVVHQAAQTNDADLFITFLSGRDPEWAQVQEEAIRSGEFYNRNGFGMVWQPSATVENPEITLSPDLQAAEVTMTQTYGIPVGNGITETVSFTQTAVYRLGPNRWLLAPPEEEFWRQTEEYESLGFAVSYPEQDAPIAARLARDLELFVHNFCSQLQPRRCLNIDGIEISMDGVTPDIGSSVIAQRQLGSRTTLVIGQLPPPSIVGWPVDELSYQSLWRGYSTILAHAIIDQVQNSDCCIENLYFQAARNALLTRLGLRPSAASLLIEPLDHRTLVSFDDLEKYWQELHTFTTSDWVAQSDTASLFLAFLLERQFVESEGHLLRSIVENNNQSFDMWLQNGLDKNVDRSTLERSWLSYQYDLTAVSQSTPPIQLPPQDIQIICRPTPQSPVEVYRYNLSSQQLFSEGALGHVEPVLRALPGDDGIIIGYRLLSSSESELILWKDNIQTNLRWSISDALPLSLPLGFDPTEQFLLVGGLGARTGLINLSLCLNDGQCNLETANGYPVWSADGTSTVVIQNEILIDNLDTQLALLQKGDALAQTDALSSQDGLSSLLGEGGSPFWLSDSRVGWISNQFELGTQIIVSAEIDIMDVEPLLSLDEFLALLPAELPMENLEFQWVRLHPLNPTKLLLGIGNDFGVDAPGFLVTFDLQTRQGTILDVFSPGEGVELGTPRFEANGRYLQLINYNKTSDRYELYLYHLETGQSSRHPLDETYAFPPHWFIDWSANHQWIAAIQDGYIQLIAPNHSHSRLVIFEQFACQGVAWVNRD